MWGTGSGTIGQRCGQVVQLHPVRFALESRVSKNTLGVSPDHGPSVATGLAAHMEMSRACCFYKCGVWLIACDQLSELLAADPVVLALASVPDFYVITGLEMLWAWVCAT